MAPALTTIAQELHMSNTEAVMAMSSYMLAAVFGPLLFGPLSEVYGRAPILHASNIWFLIFNIVCGFAKHKGTLIGARFLSGFGASAVYALGGAVLGDVWRPEQRGKSLSIYQLIPLLGGAVGPIIVRLSVKLIRFMLTFFTGCIHGSSHHMAMDVLVNIYLPGGHDCHINPGVLGNIRSCGPSSPCGKAQSGDRR